ncbi:MAG TPA: YaiO family outer membrane beta-barrel protein [Sphingobacteriaceae bacterium]
MKNFALALLLIYLSIHAQPGRSQTTKSADSLFTLARTAAFTSKDFQSAILLAKRSLIAQENTEVRVFLGRLYTWNNEADSARLELNQVLRKDPRNLEALAARFDVELWQGLPDSALHYAETGLSFYPESGEFVTRKMKALVALKKVSSALKAGNTFLQTHPVDSAVLRTKKELKDTNPLNSVGINHTLVKFDKRFDKPWNLTSLTYGRRTDFGSLHLNLNHANRFSQGGFEGELESYVNIAKGLYSYLGGGFSGSEIFPEYRLGFSLYKSLPLSFEAEGGIRYLKFAEGTTVFVVGLGKYLGSGFYSVRTFITPSSGAAPTISTTITARYFTGEDRYDSFGLSLGTGTSPDDRARDILISNNLQSIKIGADYSVNIFKRTTLGFVASWAREEYLTDTFGNQFTIGASLSQRF